MLSSCQSTACRTLPALACNISKHLKAFTWVELLHLPNPFSFDEALLLCPVSEDDWLVWIPDYEEALLHTRQFRYESLVINFGQMTNNYPQKSVTSYPSSSSMYRSRGKLSPITLL